MATRSEYLLAVHRAAAQLALDLDVRQVFGEAGWEEAATLVDELLTREPIFAGALEYSSNVEQALDSHPAGREWVQGDPASATRAVARFDVLSELPRLRNMEGTAPRVTA